MWHYTKATALLGIQYPIIQGPFGGGLSSARLVATVSNAGGMGSFGAYTNTPAEIKNINDDIRKLTDKPYALNLWVSDIDTEALYYSKEAFEKMQALYKPYFDELGLQLPEMSQNIASKFEQQAEAIISAKPAAFSFIFGIPSKEILRECKKQNIKTIGAATTPDEALALEEAGFDFVIATGFEAGGHRPSFLRPAKDSLTGTFSLVPQVADAVKIPVIAAGGVADGRGIAAALTLGASAVQIGTAFLACEESNASETHKELLFSSKARYTSLTNAFTGRLARGTSSRIATEMQTHEKGVAPLPLQSLFLSSLREAAIAQGKTDMITFWAGQSAPLIRYKKADELFKALVAETEMMTHKV